MLILFELEIKPEIDPGPLKKKQPTKKNPQNNNKKPESLGLCFIWKFDIER